MGMFQNLASQLENLENGEDDEEDDEQFAKMMAGMGLGNPKGGNSDVPDEEAEKMM